MNSNRAENATFWGNAFQAVFHDDKRERGGPKGPRARARALAKFTPVHHWEGDELK